MADDLERRLERWGEEPGPAPDAAFSHRLEADLRSAAYFGQRTPTPEPRKRWMLRPAFVMAAVVMVALVAAVAINVTDSRPTETLVMGDSTGTTVTLPGGSVETGGEGLELPDGAIIDVGPGGTATVDGVVLPPDSRAVVVDGHLELLDPGAQDPSGPGAPTGETALPTGDAAAATPTSTPTPTAAATSRPTPASPDPTATSAPTRRPTDVAPDPTPTSSATVRPTVRPTTTPSDVAPTPTPVPTPSATAQPSPTATPSPTPRPEPVRPRVDLGRSYLGPERAALVWSVTDGDAIAGWEVRIRRGDTIRTVAVIRNGSARELVVERPRRNAVFYRVIALSAAGEMLARSAEVRVVAAEVVQPGG